MMGGSVVNDWDQVVRHISVSSNENQANRLVDGSDKTYWQSSGAQGKVSNYTVGGNPKEHENQDLVIGYPSGFSTLASTLCSLICVIVLL